MVFLYLLIVWGVTPGPNAWSARVSANNESESKIVLGFLPVATVTQQRTAAGSTWSLDVEWAAVTVLLVAGYLVARVVTLAVERCVRGTTSPLAFVAAGVAFALAMAVAVACAITYSMWGYPFARPSARATVEGIATVDAVSSVTCTFRSSRPECEGQAPEDIPSDIANCRKDPYYCLNSRLLLALHDDGRLPRDTAQLSASALRKVETAFGSHDVRVRADPGYDGDRILSGVAISGVQADGRRLLALGVRGAQISNDHYPYYELLIDATDGSVVKHTVFFYDVAGLEGLEWWPIFIGAGAFGFVVSVPVSLFAASMIGLRRRMRSV